MSSNKMASRNKSGVPAVCVPFVAEATANKLLASTKAAYQTKLINEFRFVTDNVTAAWIFKDIAALVNDQPTANSVNIRAYDQRPDLTDPANTSVYLVPGDSYGRAFEDATQTADDLINTRNVLKKYCVDAKETAALFVSVASVQGQLARIQPLFNNAKITVTSSYIDESTFTIYGLNNIGAAQEILGLSLSQQDNIIAAYLKKNPSQSCGNQ